MSDCSVALQNTAASCAPALWAPPSMTLRRVAETYLKPELASTAVITHPGADIVAERQVTTHPTGSSLSESK